MPRIMIVEDDAKLREIIATHLRRYGHEPLPVTDFARVKDASVDMQPDLVLLDVNLPYYDGFYWCRQLRAVSKVPIIFLSARTSDMDQVFAMENGGDDYVTKPFSLDVLVAKINSVLRRTSGEYAAPGETNAAPAPDPADAATGSGRLYLDESRGEAVFGVRRVELTQTEFRLLSLLVRNAGRIVSRDALLEELWDDIAFVDDNTLTVNVSRVRHKLEELGFAGSIVTRRGLGYMLEAGHE